MNYNSQLQSNNTDLQQVLETLQHKAAGGNTAYETCTVNIAVEQYQGLAGIRFYYETIEDNKIVIKETFVTGGSSVSLSCLCDSMIVFSSPLVFSGNGVVRIANFEQIFICGVSAEANETAELVLSAGGSGN